MNIRSYNNQSTAQIGEEQPLVVDNQLLLEQQEHEHKWKKKGFIAITFLEVITIFFLVSSTFSDVVTGGETISLLRSSQVSGSTSAVGCTGNGGSCINTSECCLPSADSESFSGSVCSGWGQSGKECLYI